MKIREAEQEPGVPRLLVGGRAQAAERREQAAVLGEALSRCPALCGSPAARTAGDCTAVSTPPGSERGKASPRWPGTERQPSSYRGAEPSPHRGAHAELRPFFPLSRLYAITSRPRLSATVRGYQPTPPLGSPPDAPTPRGQGRSPGARPKGPGRRPRADAHPVSMAPSPSPLQQLRSPALTP